MQFLTRELWHGIHNGLPRHPMLWYPLRNQEPQASNIFWVRHAPALSLAVAVGIALFLWTAFDVAPITLVFILNAYAGLVIAGGIARGIYRVRLQGLMTLMGVTPSGRTAAFWALMMRYMRRNPTVTGLHQAAAWLHAGWFLALLLWAAALVVTFAWQGVDAPYTGLMATLTQPMNFLNAALLLGITVMDYMAALIAGALIGVLVPMARDIDSDSVYLTPVVFLTSQVLLYVLLFLFHFIAGLLLAALGLLTPLTSSIIFMLIYVALREGSLWLLCRLLARLLNTDVRDVLTVHRNSI